MSLPNTSLTLHPAAQIMLPAKEIMRSGSPSAKIRTFSSSTLPSGKRSRSVTMRFLLRPISLSPDQPAIAAPLEKMRSEPSRNGSAKHSSAAMGTPGAKMAE